MSDDPKWVNGDPQIKLSTYWRACYKIGSAPRVVVAEYCRHEKEAQAKAEEALDAALKEIAKHKIPVEASSWIEKHQSRTQYRTFEPSNVEEVVLNDWHGTFTIIGKSVWENEKKRRMGKA